jgi:HK97 family phage portal protein
MRSLGLTKAPRGWVERPDFNVGWHNGSSVWAGAARGETRITSPLNTYGATEQSSVWVYACCTIRSQQLAAYPWWLHQWDDPHTPIDRASKRGEVPELYTLLEEPNDEMTYFDLAEQVEMDLYLTGDSFWMLDQMNPLGQPLAMEWLMPGTVKVATNDQGKRIGYVYTPKEAAQPIPLMLNEVIHFRNRNPLNRYYGMGVVEAIYRSVDRDLAQGAHVTAFFEQGAHLSGVLTVPETIGEEEFERMKRQYENEFRNSSNRFNVLIAEGAQSYTPITSTPGVIGTVDLSRMSKDEILSGSGVPEFLLGGTGQGGVYKMEEAQNILHRTMIPVAGRFARRIKMDLTGRYFLDMTGRQKRIGFHVDPRQSDTPSAKVERARKLVGTGATIDMMLEMAGQDRLNWGGITDVPLIPSGLVPVTKEQGFDAGAAGSTGPNPPPNSGAEEDPNNEPGGDGDSNDPRADSDQDEDGSARRGFADSMIDDLVARAAPPVTPPVWTTQPLAQVQQAASELRAQRAALGAGKARGEGDDPLREALRDFFLAQRTRCIDHLGQFGATKGGNLRSKPLFPKSDLDPEQVLDAQEELADLRERLSARGTTMEDVKANELIRHTHSAVAGVVSEGLRRGLSVSQIAAGFPMERYAGVLGVFDDLMGRLNKGDLG